MARDFFIAGEVLVKVKFADHVYSPNLYKWAGAIASGKAGELGLATDSIHVMPKFYHKGIRTDDYGPICPAEILNQLAECRIRMTLVHVDDVALKVAISESLAGASAALTTASTSGLAIGTMPGAGTPMGAYRPVTRDALNNVVLASGCHFMSLNLVCAQSNLPYRFPTAYLPDPPMDFPLGTGHSLIVLEWRAIPYPIDSANISEIRSKGKVLYDHGQDA